MTTTGFCSRLDAIRRDRFCRVLSRRSETVFSKICGGEAATIYIHGPLCGLASYRIVLNAAITTRLCTSFAVHLHWENTPSHAIIHVKPLSTSSVTIISVIDSKIRRTRVTLNFNLSARNGDVCYTRIREYFLQM